MPPARWGPEGTLVRLGDLLEIIGIAGLAVAAYLAAGLDAGLGVAAVGLVYEGQCYGHISLPGLMQVLGETRYRRIAALEEMLGQWPGARPAAGESEKALRDEVAWLEAAIIFRHRLDLDVDALRAELAKARQALRRFDEQ